MIIELEELVKNGEIEIKTGPFGTISSEGRLQRWQLTKECLLSSYRNSWDIKE